MLQSGLKTGPDPLFVLLDVQHLDKLPPVDERLRLELAVVEQQVDFFGGEGDVEGAEGLLEHEVGDLAALLLVDFGEDLLESLGTGGEDVLEVVDLGRERGTNLLH